MGNYVWKIKAKPPYKKEKKWLLDILARNRGLTGPKKLNEFLNADFEQIIDIKLTDLDKAIKRVEKALQNKEKIVVYSDYDADGISATAIVWEVLFDLGADVAPYVPHRVKEGYGLSIEAISQLARDNVSLIITVDHGVTAVSQIEHAKKLSVDVIVTDHHVLPKKLPLPAALVHSVNLCGAGVAFRFCWEIIMQLRPSYKEQLLKKLELTALATIADLVPLLGANRTIVKLGLLKLADTQRPGIIALLRAANVNRAIGTYEIGHILAPRINAMGRIGHGLDSLRLLCTKSQDQANSLAKLLSKTNSKRQDLTTKAISGAQEMVGGEDIVSVIAHESWHEGVIGLVASRLVEFFHRPMIVIARGEKHSKGSARSIPGFNIVEAIRASGEYLVDVGGHPMAAGFTIETRNIEIFRESVNKYARGLITEELLEKKLEIECELQLTDINLENLKTIEMFEPFGIGNPQPYFLTSGMLVEDVRAVGSENQHLKLQVDGIEAIGFGLGEKRSNMRPGDTIDLVYSLSQNHYNGRTTLQLKIKDLGSKNQL